MRPPLRLTPSARWRIMDDKAGAGGPDDHYSGTLIETDYGILDIDDRWPGMAMLAVGDGAPEWNYAWVLLEQLDDDYAFVEADVWISAARSEKRTRYEFDAKDYWPEDMRP